MARIFISYSSLDNQTARKLAKDLEHYGHEIWFDEWSIQVGQCIPTEISEGIENSDFILLLLSKTSVESSWVDKEWKSAYWDEVNEQSISILPILLETCEIPRLLKTKRYANFEKSYAIGFHELIGSIDVYSEARGLITSYEASSFDLPKIVRSNKDLIELTLLQLTAKATRLIGKPIAINNARVFSVFGSSSGYVHFMLKDSTGSYSNCYVLENTSLEDFILNKPIGDFYGVIQMGPSPNAFIVSEYEETHD
ncbi:MAG: toll/interleukin-1 receptor domain-containing protein [Cyanobacteria bacterium P01_G01_bin.4]